MTLGLDIGGTKIEAALIDNEKVVRTKKVQTDISSETAFYKQIEELIQEMEPLGSIGIGIAGPVKNHIVPLSPNLHFKNIDLRKALGREDIYVLNDVEAAAYAECKMGRPGLKDFLVVYLGTGIGSFLSQPGFKKNIELGHMTIDLHGSKCTCGARGCLETLSSGWALAQRSGKDTISAFQNSPLIEEAITGLKYAFKNAINQFEPKEIILGGGLLQGYLKYDPLFIEHLEERIRAEVLPSYPVKISVSSLACFAGAIGAASFALDVSKKRSQS